MADVQPTTTTAPVPAAAPQAPAKAPTTSSTRSAASAAKPPPRQRSAERMSSRLQKLVSAEPGSAPETPDRSPPTAGSSSAESASADAPTTNAPLATADGEGGTQASPEAPTTEPIDPAVLRQRALEEKLAAAREARRAARASIEEAARLRREREAAEAERKAIAEERAKLDAWKKKPLLERVVEEGQTPADAYEKMRQEALKANTPEARIEALQEAHRAEMAALKDELKSLRDERQTERAEAEKRQAEHVFQSEFHRCAKDPDYAPLLEEYEPEQLFGIASTLRRDPERLFAQARALGLTVQGTRFTMDDIFTVLKATQDAHRRRLQTKTQRPAEAAQEPAREPTVNGTTARRNAVTNVLGNENAGQKLTGTPRQTRQQRVQRLIQRG